MTSISRKQRAAIVVGGAALATGIAAPAVAATYPPNPGQNSGATTTGTTDSSGSATPAYTGSSATTFGLLAGLAAVGVGGGLLVASRRKKNA